MFVCVYLCVFSVMSEVKECLVDAQKLGFPWVLSYPGAYECTPLPLTVKQLVNQQK